MSESSRHEIDHAEMDDSFAGLGGAFVVFAISSVAYQPGEGPLDDPAFGQDDKAFHRDGSQHCLQHPTESVADPLGQTVATIGRVGKKDFQATIALDYLPVKVFLLCH